MTEDTWVRVADAADVPPGTVKGVGLPGTKTVLALCNVEGELHALDNDCPHREGPLSAGRLVGGEIECPWHRFRFDPRTGRGTVPDAFEPVPRYAVRLLHGHIEVRTTPEAPQPSPPPPDGEPERTATSEREAAQLVHGT